MLSVSRGVGALPPIILDADVPHRLGSPLHGVLIGVG
jgi:hypothetical protein